MAEAFGADVERFPDGFGAGGFAGVVGEAQAGLSCARAYICAKRFGAAMALVAAETDADDGGKVGAHLGGLLKDALGFGHGEVAHGVEDPVNRQAEFAFGTEARALEACEDGLEAVRGRDCATCR